MTDRRLETEALDLSLALVAIVAAAAGGALLSGGAERRRRPGFGALLLAPAGLWLAAHALGLVAETPHGRRVRDGARERVDTWSRLPFEDERGWTGDEEYEAWPPIGPADRY